MATRIRGITVEINGDTTNLQKSLEGVDKNIRNTQSQLKDVEKLKNVLNLSGLPVKKPLKLKIITTTGNSSMTR